MTAPTREEAEALLAQMRAALASLEGFITAAPGRLPPPRRLYAAKEVAARLGISDDVALKRAREFGCVTEISPRCFRIDLVLFEAGLAAAAAERERNRTAGAGRGARRARADRRSSST